MLEGSGFVPIIYRSGRLFHPYMWIRNYCSTVQTTVLTLCWRIAICQKIPNYLTNRTVLIVENSYIW
jgi:hypothetical protein